MRILDIDMDYFQTDIHNNETDKESFLCDEHINVWDKAEFISFIERKCGLSKTEKINGKIITYHKEAYFVIKGLIDAGILEQPFDLTHIDAHSDMGFSMDVEYYKFLQSIDTINHEAFVCGTLFSLEDNLKYINSGNYINALAMNHWVNEITYVYHPKLQEFDVIINNYDCIQPGRRYRYNFMKRNLLEKPEIILMSSEEYKNTERYDYVIVSISPSFTKQEIMELVYIIREYIDEV